MIIQSVLSTIYPTISIHIYIFEISSSQHIPFGILNSVQDVIIYLSQIAGWIIKLCLIGCRLFVRLKLTFHMIPPDLTQFLALPVSRSEERRVGKECRYRRERASQKTKQ